MCQFILNCMSDSVGSSPGLRPIPVTSHSDVFDVLLATNAPGVFLTCPSLSRTTCYRTSRTARSCCRSTRGAESPVWTSRRTTGSGTPSTGWSRTCRDSGTRCRLEGCPVPLLAFLPSSLVVLSDTFQVRGLLYYVVGVHPLFSVVNTF